MKYDEASGMKKILSDKLSTSPNPHTHTHPLDDDTYSTYSRNDGNNLCQNFEHSALCAGVCRFSDLRFDRCPEGYLVLKIKNVSATHVEEPYKYDLKCAKELRSTDCRRSWNISFWSSDNVAWTICCVNSILYLR